MKKKRLESQLAYQQARYLKGCETLKQHEQRLSATEAELQELRAAYEDQILSDQVSDRVTQGWITADDLGSAFAELARELGFTPPYVFEMQHDKETGEIIILTGLNEKDDGLLYVNAASKERSERLWESSKKSTKDPNRRCLNHPQGCP